jgi:LacI family transcriptional regulator
MPTSPKKAAADDGVTRPAKPRAIRMRDVAAVAGVDISVVSRVLSGDERLVVRPETRERVLEAVTRLNYRPNIAARALKTARTMAIGMVVPDLANTAYTEIARGADERAAELGYTLLVASGRMQERLPTLEGRIDGLLYAVATSDSTAPHRLPEQIPSLLVNRREPGLGASIIANDEEGVALATQHLIDLGHTHIGLIVADFSVDTHRRRAAGYRRAMRAAGLPDASESILETAFDEAGGYEATLELLRREPRPTALFVARGPTVPWTLGALAACDELGVSVPDDLSLIVLSDVPIADYLRPAVTSLELPLATLGSRAIDQLLRLIDGEAVADAMVDEPPRLMVRETTAAPPGRR